MAGLMHGCVVLLSLQTPSVDHQPPDHHARRFTSLVPALTRWGTTAVGLTLVAIGALGIYESFFEQHHVEAKEAAIAALAAAEPAANKAACQQQQFVVQADGSLAATAAAAGPSSSTAAAAAGVKKEKRGFGLATFASGIAFGLQPDALFVIVPALTLPTKLAAAVYILMFVLGTVAAMGAYTGLIGATSGEGAAGPTGLNLRGAAPAVLRRLPAGALEVDVRRQPGAVHMQP